MKDETKFDIQKELEREQKAQEEAFALPRRAAGAAGSSKKNKNKVAPESVKDMPAKKKRELEKKLIKEEREKRRIFSVMLAGIAAIIIAIIVVANTSPLDRINRYDVTVTPLENGKLRITYDIDWEVLNSTREGPLTWVKFGMANENFTIVSMGGAIDYERSIDGPYVAFDLDDIYNKGDRLNIKFTVEQDNLLAYNEADGTYYYWLTPGWFDAIKVKAYQFTWENDEAVISHNADEAGSYLEWSGSFQKSGKREMQVVYSPQFFEGGVRAVPSSLYYNSAAGVPKEARSNSSGMVAGIVIVIFFLMFALFALFADHSSYNAGRGYGHAQHVGFFGGRGGGGGGGCACACAGCACACACAGGGRAGCTTKDFYASSVYAGACVSVTEVYEESSKKRVLGM